MSSRFIRPMTLLGTLALASTTLAQQGVDTGSASSADPHVVLRALETMNSASSSKLADALSHEKSLRSYAEAHGMSEACSGESSDGSHDMKMSFEKALQIAIDHEEAAPSGYAEQATPGEIKAYTTLARSTWNKLQAAMANVEHLSDCLHGTGNFDDYLGWTHDQAAQEHEAMQARNAEISKENQEKEKDLEARRAAQYEAFKKAQKAQHEAFLKQSWTKYKFDQTNDLKAYKYRTKYGPNSYYNSYSGSIYGGGGGWYGGGYLNPY